MAALSVGPEQAIDAARRCSETRGTLRWSEERLSVKREVVRDHDCWTVSTDAPLDVEPGQPSWFGTFTDAQMRYFIDAETGECIGVQVGQARHYFTPA